MELELSWSCMSRPTPFLLRSLSWPTLAPVSCKGVGVAGFVITTPGVELELESNAHKCLLVVFLEF